MRKRRIFRTLAVFTLLLCLINFIILPDTVVTSYRNINGVESYEYGEKVPALLLTLSYVAISCFLLKSSEDRTKRLPEKPKPQAKPGKLLPLAGWVFIVMGLLGNFILFLLNL